MSEEAKKQAETVQVPEGAQETAPQAPDLTVNDLQALKDIIDVASQRGSFRPNEMVTVGQTYNKLDTFLTAVAAQQQAGQESAKGEK